MQNNAKHFKAKISLNRKDTLEIQMPKKLTEKKIKKRELVHPRSRKAEQLARAKLRQKKLQDHKDKVHLKKSPLLLRLSWFQEILKGSEAAAPTAEEMNEWIKMYIDRFDDELEAVKAQMRPGRPIPIKYDEVKSAKKQELDEFEGPGFEMADVLSEKAYKAFMEFDCTTNSLHLIKLIRYKKLPEFSEQMSD